MLIIISFLWQGGILRSKMTIGAYFLMSITTHKCWHESHLNVLIGTPTIITWISQLSKCWQEPHTKCVDCNWALWTAITISVVIWSRLNCYHDLSLFVSLYGIYFMEETPWPARRQHWFIIQPAPPFESLLLLTWLTWLRQNLICALTSMTAVTENEMEIQPHF